MVRREGYHRSIKQTQNIDYPTDPKEYSSDRVFSTIDGKRARVYEDSVVQDHMTHHAFGGRTHMPDDSE